MEYAFIIAGLVVGTAVGLTGIGGSALLAPILTLFLGVPASLTVGTDLLYSVPTKIFACVLHARRGNVDWKVTRALLLGGLPGALVGLILFGYLLAKVDRIIFEASLKHAIGVAVLIACFGVLLTSIWRRRTPQPDEAAVDASALPRWRVVTIGAAVGFLVAVTSIGAGSVTLPLLTFALRSYPLRRLIGSEIAFAAFLVPLAALGHVAFNNVNWHIAAALVIGSLPGVWIGTQLASMLGERWLRPVIAGLLALSGWKLV